MSRNAELIKGFFLVGARRRLSRHHIPCCVSDDKKLMYCQFLDIQFLGVKHSVDSITIAKIRKFLQNKRKMEKNVKISTEKSNPLCSLNSLSRVLRERCQCLPNSFANVFLALMPVISDGCIPCLPRPHARILLRLLPVSSEASCSLLPCSEAHHQLVLTLVITPLSGACLLMRYFQRISSRVFTLFVVKPSFYHVKSFHKKKRKQIASFTLFFVIPPCCDVT